MIMTKLVSLSKKGQLVLPKEMRDKLGIKENDKIMMILDTNGIILTTPELYAQRSKGILKGTWGKNKKEIEAYINGERKSWE